MWYIILSDTMRKNLYIATPVKHAQWDIGTYV